MTDEDMYIRTTTHEVTSLDFLCKRLLEHDSDPSTLFERAGNCLCLESCTHGEDVFVRLFVGNSCNDCLRGMIESKYGPSGIVSSQYSSQCFLYGSDPNLIFFVFGDGLIDEHDTYVTLLTPHQFPLYATYIGSSANPHVYYLVRFTKSLQAGWDTK